MTSKKSRRRAGPIRVSDSYKAVYSEVAGRATECVLNAIRTADLLLAGVGSLWAKHGLSASAGNALVILHGAGQPLPPHVISDRMLVTRGAITGLLDSLEKRGLIRRTRHPDDRRKLLVEVTPAGLDLVKLVQPQIVELEIKMLACLSDQEQETFIELNGTLQRHLNEFFSS